MNPNDRKLILVVGSREFSDTDRHYFAIRDLKIATCNFSECNERTAGDILASARGLLIAEPAGKYTQLSNLPRILELATNQGLVVAYWAQTQEDQRHAEGALKNVSPIYNTGDASGKKWAYLRQDLEALAEFFRTHDPGCASGKATIEFIGGEFKFQKYHELLLRRAFWNACHVAVEKLADGATNQAVYRIYATLNTMDGPREPIPFVFKVGSTEQIQKECGNYRDEVEPFVDFHLRPGLIRDRCVFTPHSSALTCNLVGGATRLEEAISSGQAAGVLFSLFETTLRGFRNHTMASGSQTSVVQTFIKSRVNVARLREMKDDIGIKRIRRAEEMGLRRSPEGLERDVEHAAMNLQSFCGLQHGDLHVGNVMVRHKDAIIIDFGSVRRGPITVDPASLEVSISFGTRKDESENTQEKWFKFIDAIYTNPMEPPRPSPDHDVLSRVNTAVREIRQITYSSAVSPREFVIVLIASLLRYARFAPLTFPSGRLIDISEERKAYSLLKAEHMLDNVLPRYEN